LENGEEKAHFSGFLNRNLAARQAGHAPKLGN
jgi:hypothetical protein